MVLFLAGGLLYGKEVVLKIPFSHQTKAYGCGQNSFRMVMGYWGEDIEKAKLYGYTGYNPTTTKDFQKIIKDRYSDFRFKKLDKEIAAVIESIDAKRPVMIETSAAFLPYLPYESAAGHYIVAVGYNTEKKHIYVRDPNSFYVESLTFEELEQSWQGKQRSIFAVFRKDGKYVKPDKIKHYSDKAKPFGAEKEKRTTPFYAYLVPTLYTVFNTSENGIKNTTLKDDWLYTIKIQGLHFGHIQLDSSPWLYQDVPFYGIAANLGFDFGRTKVLFNDSDAFSPGVFRYLQERTLAIRSFSSIKTVPALTIPSLVVEGSFYSSLLDVLPEGKTGPYPLLNPYNRLSNPEASDLVFSKLRGGRVNLRRGINQTWGYLSGGVTLNSVEIHSKSADKDHRLNVLGGDITLGPVEGAVQYYKNTFNDGTKAELLALSAALNLTLPKISGGIFSVLDFIGLFRSYYQFTYEDFLYNPANTSRTALTRSIHHVEFPMFLRVVDFVYGFDFIYSDKAFDSFKIGGRVLFNMLLPYFQAQAGYTYTARANDTNNHALHVGIYAGLW
jgi:hypothetical protein